QRRRYLLGGVDPARLEALEEILDGEVEVDDLIGLLEEAVGDGLADRHLGDALDEIVQTLEVLDVEGADDVDAGGEELEDVLIALAIAAARNVGVGDLVDDHDLGPAGQDRVEVEVLDEDAPVLDAATGDDLEPVDELGGLGATVGLDVGDDAVDAAL